MTLDTMIAASHAKAKFFKLLERTRQGESFTITLHGEEVAKLVPAHRTSLEDVRQTIANLKANRTVLNPPKFQRLQVKDLIEQGRR